MKKKSRESCDAHKKTKRLQKNPTCESLGGKNRLSKRCDIHGDEQKKKIHEERGKRRQQKKENKAGAHQLIQRGKGCAATWNKQG